jgi:hypothetical protein
VELRTPHFLEMEDSGTLRVKKEDGYKSIWVLYASLACLSMGTFNYISATMNHTLVDSLSGKVVNSIILGIASIILQIGQNITCCKK